MKSRTATETRKTLETNVRVELNLDGSGKFEIKTGVGFFDHMLEQLAKHSMIDLKVEADGDLHIDAHHTVEDVGICIGSALRKAVGDKKGINRYGSSVVVMDEARSRVDLDFSGRAYCIWNVSFTMERLGDLDTELIHHFFHSVAANAGITLHVQNDYGVNNHHISESVFKACAKALRHAVEPDPRASGALPSTKGAL